MSPFRYRDEDESSSTGTILGVVAGALAGFAVGMYVAQRVGGFEGLKSKIARKRAGAGAAAQSLRERYAAQDQDEEEFDDIEDDDLENGSFDESLEERVLEAFRNDPILS